MFLIGILGLLSSKIGLLSKSLKKSLSFIDMLAAASAHNCVTLFYYISQTNELSFKYILIIIILVVETAARIRLLGLVREFRIDWHSFK